MNAFMNYRGLNALGFLACTAAMGFAYLLQYGYDLEPCSMCMLQRIAMVSLGIFFLIAFIHNPSKTGLRIYGTLQLLAATAGEVLAGRHVWLQHLPEDKVPACGPNWDFMVDEFPIMEIIATIMKGAGECAEISWELMGLSIPEQLLIGFSLLWLLALMILLQPKFLTDKMALYKS